MKCKHQWIAVQVSPGSPLYQDQCKHCHSVGQINQKTGEITARPLAQVIDLAAYRIKKLKEKGVVNG